MPRSYGGVFCSSECFLLYILFSVIKVYRQSILPFLEINKMAMVNTKELMTFDDARAWVGKMCGHVPSRPAFSYWIHRGIRGVKLSVHRMFGRVWIDEKDLRTFIESI